VRFVDQTVVVTGASQGIGREIACAFAREGAHVAALDVDQGGLETLAREIGGDVSKGADIARAVENVLGRWKRVDVLVNNAGGFKELRRTEDIPEEEWDFILRFNLTSVFLCSKAVLPTMRQQRCGRIINVSSFVRGGVITVSSHYVAAKAGLLGFTRHLAREVGITVNAVAPGVVSTERYRQIRSPAEIARTVETIPMRRLGETGDISESVLFLASEAAGYITGATLDVNGGFLMTG
jgi:NAD(P)-dependent dehydrogenase (short-subunit alcohol dehydrogenase family)